MVDKPINHWTSKDIDAAKQQGWLEGYKKCKEDVLKIIQKPIQNLDLSWEICDSRYIDKIEEL